MPMQDLKKYRIRCTLTYGDIYSQIIIWLIVIFIALATSLALWSTARQIYALATVGLIVLLSIPFLLFAFVTTLFNHIEVLSVDPTIEDAPNRAEMPGSQAAQVAS